jgi:ferric-dicitrate binding protein FerR (iron transport regulator)
MDAAQIEAQAAKWLIQLDRPSPPATSAALDAWLGSHPRRRAAFLRLSVAWRRMDRLRRRDR